MGRVARAIQTAGADGTEVYDVMTATGLNALEASRAIANLTATGQVTQDSEGRFVPATA